MGAAILSGMLTVEHLKTSHLRTKKYADFFSTQEPVALALKSGIALFRASPTAEQQLNC